MVLLLIALGVGFLRFALRALLILRPSDRLSAGLPALESLRILGGLGFLGRLLFILFIMFAMASFSLSSMLDFSLLPF